MVSPDSKVHGANMGPIWGRQDLGGPHVGHMNFAIWDGLIMDKQPIHQSRGILQTTIHFDNHSCPGEFQGNSKITKLFSQIVTIQNP